MEGFLLLYYEGRVLGLEEFSPDLCIYGMGAYDIASFSRIAAVDRIVGMGIGYSKLRLEGSCELAF